MKQVSAGVLSMVEVKLAEAAKSVKVV